MTNKSDIASSNFADRVDAGNRKRLAFIRSIKAPATDAYLELSSLDHMFPDDVSKHPYGTYRKNFSKVMIKSFYDNVKVIEDLHTNQLLEMINSYMAAGDGVDRQSSERLGNIKKEVLLLSPFLKKGVMTASLDEGFEGLVISLSNAFNTISIVANGNHRISFSYLLKSSRSSVAIDGRIDLEEDDDNINYKGLEKLLGVYSGA